MTQTTSSDTAPSETATPYVQSQDDTTTPPWGSRFIHTILMLFFPSELLARAAQFIGRSYWSFFCLVTLVYGGTIVSFAEAQAVAYPVYYFMDPHVSVAFGWGLTTIGPILSVPVLGVLCLLRYVGTHEDVGMEREYSATSGALLVVHMGLQLENALLEDRDDMPPKRGTGGGAARRAKRTKITADVSDVPYELVLNGERYVDVDKLFKSPSLAPFFNKQYKRSVARFIAETKLPVVFVTKKHATQGLLSPKNAYSPKSDVRVTKLTDTVQALIARATESLLPAAPPIITDADLAFFVDEGGTRYAVEMRGERTMGGILFKAKDVGTVFGSDNFVRTLQDARGAYEASIDYKVFTLPDQCTSSNVQSSSKAPNLSPSSSKANPASNRTLFLTFEGLMHALHSTRSPVANEFRSWVYNHVFTIAYGTEDQKKAMVQELCRVDKRFLEAFMKLVPSDIACLYLVDTNKRENGKRVLKFGRSGNVKDRFYKHAFTFGDDCLLDTLVLVPGDMLSDAEARFNGMIAENFRYQSGKSRELLLLDAAGYKAIRACMQTVADKYNGSLAVHSLIVDSEVKDVQSQMREQRLEYELRIVDLERMLDVVNERARAELTLERGKVAVMEEQLEASKQQVVAIKRELEQQLETSRLRLQVQELQFQAQLLEKDRRIAELEMKSYRSGGMNAQCPP